MNAIKLCALVFASALIPFAVRAQLYLPAGLTLEYIQQPHQWIVAWDMHDVLVSRGKLKTTALFATNSPLLFSSGLKVGLSQILSPLTGMPNNEQKAWQEIKMLPAGMSFSAETYETIFKKYQLKELAEFAKSLDLSYLPTPGIQAIVQSLHTAGIEQRLASNIGPRVFEEYKTETKSPIFDMISPGMVVSIPLKRDTKLAEIAAPAAAMRAPFVSPHNICSFAKPDPRYFKQFISIFNAALDHLVLFIDDRLDNIKAAVDAGMIGFHFDRTQDLNQLLKELDAALHSLGILH